MFSNVFSLLLPALFVCIYIHKFVNNTAAMDYECTRLILDDCSSLKEIISLEFFLQKISERPQPYVLLPGGSKIHPQQSFVIIERHAQGTFMKAIDVCFKSFYVFNMEYQNVCLGAWEFFQKVVYELPGGVKCNQIRDFCAYRANKKDKVTAV